MKKRLISGLLLFPVSALTMAASSPQAKAVPAMAGADLARWSLGLIMVLAAIFACAWLVRKLGAFPAGVSGALRVVGGVSLGARERVVLLQAGTKHLVLGVSPGRIQTLHILDEEEVAALKAAAPASSGPGSFSQRFQEAMKGVRRG